MLNLHSADKQIEITFIPVRTLETAEGKILFCGADVANEVVKHEGVSKTTREWHLLPYHTSSKFSTAKILKTP